jgi:hypothetical protein
MTMKPRNPAKFWRVRAEQDLDVAQRLLLKLGQLEPFFVVHGGDGEAHIVPARFPNLAAKEMAAHYVRLICVVENAVAVTHIGEAWTREVLKHPDETQQELRARAEAVPPSKAEDRIEVIIVQTTWRTNTGKDGLILMCRIERGDDGLPNGCTLLDYPHGELTGRFTDILPEYPPTPAEREEARWILKALETVHPES